MNLLDLMVTVSVDDKASTQIDTLSGKISGGLSSAAGLAATALGAIGFAELANEAIEASDSTDKFKQTLNFAGLDTGQIDALSASTKAYADQTVYSLSDIQNMTAQLAANGVPNYDKLAEAAGNLNAVAGGNAETYKSVGMVMTQVAGAGKLTAENWNQLADAIPGASGKLQEAMLANGAYTGNFRDAMAAGEITADEFNQAIMDLGMTDVAEEAATSTSTFEGAFGNLQAAAVSLITDGLNLIKPAATTAINGLATVLSSVTPAIQSAFSAITEMFSSGGGMDFISGLATQLQEGFGQMAANLAPAFESVLPYVQQFVDALVNMGTTYSSMVGPYIQAFVNLLMQLGTTISAALAPVISTMLPIFMQLGTMLVNFGTQIMSIVIPALTNIFNTVSQVFAAIQPIIVNAMTVIMGIVQSVWPSIQTIIQGAMTAIQSVITMVMGVIQGVISTVLAAINGDWSGVMNGLQSIASAVWNGISGIVSGVMTAVQGFISAGLSLIQGLWDAAWNGLKSLLESAWQGISSAVQTGVDNVVSFISGLPGTIQGLFAGAGQWLWDAGSQIIDGLLSGLKSAWDGVTGWFSSITSQIPSLKGPEDVDKRLLVKNGQLIMGGLQKGLESGWGEVEDFLSSKTAAIPMAVNAQPAFAAGGYSTAGQTVKIEQNFYQPVQSAAEFARAQRKLNNYGLAGQRG